MPKRKSNTTTNTNVYIYQLEASKFMQVAQEKNNLTFSDLKLNFKGSLPDSLELRYVQKHYPNKFSVHKQPFIDEHGEKLETEFIRTTAIIDVSFNNDFREKLNSPVKIYKKNKIDEIKYTYGKVILKQNEVRKKFYEEGFNLNGVHYVLFKRSSSKSRVNQSLFIDESMLDDIQNWGRLNLEFKENEPCDCAGLMSYESLTLSGLINTIRIEPHEVLLIDDCQSDFSAKASVTEFNSKYKKLVVTERMEQQTSDIFDGQSLLDVSKFVGEYKNKGCLLLRNKFFKSCAFSCNIKQWFEDNNITCVSQLQGLTLAKNIEDIKLITTPNSLKALKFAYKLDCPKETKQETMFKYWLDNIDFDFGVCKYDKPSQFGEYQQTSYQMLNSLPLSYDDVLELAQPNIKQIEMLKNDFESFKAYIGIGDRIDILKKCCLTFAM